MTGWAATHKKSPKKSRLDTLKMKTKIQAHKNLDSLKARKPSQSHTDTEHFSNILADSTNGLRAWLGKFLVCCYSKFPTHVGFFSNGQLNQLFSHVTLNFQLWPWPSNLTPACQYDQRSFSSRVRPTCPNIHTGSIALPRPLKWSISMNVLSQNLKTAGLSSINFSRFIRSR